ncbi:MAG TPA: hypothetical protein DDZ51_16990 [Planctomycetaceae bacterium]|nr:hypothetical protein [Planctomycetaceae bacterium]
MFLKKIKSIARTLVNKSRNEKNPSRCLEIGPGGRRIAGFETLNVVDEGEVDYVHDAAKRLPFKSNTFNVIYASHVLEHIPWYQTADVLRDWVRVLRPSGALEIWVPDGLKICSTLVDYEINGIDETKNDGWYRWNDDKDVCRWAAGRMYTYGDGTGTLNHPNWHRALFTQRYLEKLLREAGLVDLRKMDKDEVRGYDHGWINLGVRGLKP